VLALAVWTIHLVDADREPLGLGARRRGLHRLRVEDHDVCLEAVAEQAAIGQAQALRREGCHLPDGVGQRQEALLADELGEDDRKGAHSLCPSPETRAST